jgi:hypothetical protein
VGSAVNDAVAVGGATIPGDSNATAPDEATSVAPKIAGLTRQKRHNTLYFIFYPHTDLRLSRILNYQPLFFKRIIIKIKREFTLKVVLVKKRQF